MTYLLACRPFTCIRAEANSPCLIIQRIKPCKHTDMYSKYERIPTRKQYCLSMSCHVKINTCVNAQISSGLQSNKKKSVVNYMHCLPSHTCPANPQSLYYYKCLCRSQTINSCFLPFMYSRLILQSNALSGALCTSTSQST